MEDDAFNEATAQSPLLTCSFNQDGGCLAVGTTSGFSVHNLHPTYARTVNRELQGGVGIVEMLFRCNLMALVGGGPTPQAPPHRVLIWDDHIPKEIGELSFRQVVLQVRLRKDAIAVALRDRVYVYHLADLSLRDKIYTADNVHGLLCLSTQIQDMVLACPSVTTGHVRVELYGLRKTVLLEAHESALRGLALTADGTKVATASLKGTVIRLWDVASATCLQEFRRGVERATITCLSFSWDYKWLACTSDKGTAHIFEVESAEDKEEKRKEEASSTLTQMLFSTVRRSVEGDAKKSVCQVRGVPHPQACAFVAEATNLLAIAGWDADGNGVLLISEFQAGAEARRAGYHVLCQSAVPDESDEERRRRRLRGWTPQVPQTPEGGRLYVGERLEILEKGMDQIRFDEEDDDEFVAVTTVKPEDESANPKTTIDGIVGGVVPVESPQSEAGSSSQATDDAARSNVDSGTVGDSVRTESLGEGSEL
mmetsp:Transcript_20546/g.26478  ORF Transcript_20546/g.26478 Transcript_20546/m.26478 type:complete len:482 (+) Transcript_20546:144-1589(+)|eukprot:CAMPEP_0198151984 /NCGR_PEP_ID=MMETSP1443-20131203/57995_1 /TAXON_ID=186043 /ORGANISM="Entomoneis sp., Strain CCMP2396" /LENGTH=481 /DNA_ID=CAMNT_0043817853 /DNA_START=86 /DNA_END=1531 /DNA_ORIENTATION=+